MTRFDAIVLAGGNSQRLGTDKTRVRIDDSSVLERVLAAVDHAAYRYVVGAQQTDLHTGPLHWLREDPPGSGPAAAVATAAERVESAVVVVLAGDLPYVGRGTVDRMLDIPAERAGSVLHDADGRPQWLSVAVRTAVLRARVAERESWAGAAMYELFGEMDLVAVPATGEETHDIDTPEDIPS